MSTSESTDPHVAVLAPSRSPTPCNSSSILGSLDDMHSHNPTIFTTPIVALNQNGPRSSSLPQLRLSSTFSFPPPPVFQLIPLPRCSPVLSLHDTGSPYSACVSHPPFHLTPAHPNSACGAPFEHTDSMECQGDSHPHGHE